MKEALKNWKTTSIGVIILAGLAYTAFTKGFEITDAVSGFVALGFIMAKDPKKK